MTENQSKESGHWYCATTGQPRYTIIGKNGKERNTTLRDAKTDNLVPSVSTINGLLAKNGLQTWLQTEVLKATLANPRIAGEDEKDYISRVLDLSKAKSREAANRGTYIHTIVQSYFELDISPEWPAYVHKVQEALDDHFGKLDWVAERSFASPEGYGGKCDLFASGALVDIKTTEKSPGDLTPYYENTLQLAAYREGLMPGARCANVYINAETHEVAIIEHSEQDLKDGYEAFLSLLRVYKLKNKLQ